MFSDSKPSSMHIAHCQQMLFIVKLAIVSPSSHQNKFQNNQHNSIVCGRMGDCVQNIHTYKASI